MKKNIIAGIVAAVVVATGTGAIAYHVGHNTASETAAIENAVEMGTLYSQAEGIVADQMSMTQDALSKLAKAQKSAKDQYNAAQKANQEKIAAEKKAAEEKAAREKAEEAKKAAEEKAKAEAEQQKAEATQQAKIGIKNIIRAELKNSTDGRLSQDSINYIKGQLANAEAQGHHITFTNDDIRSMDICDEDVTLLGLQIVG